jgi:transposase
MKPYPLELRQRIITAVEQQTETIEELAALFGVSERYVYKLLRLQRETRDLAPRPHGGGQICIEKRNPDLKKALEQLLDYEMAGNPMNEQVWVRCSPERLANQLKESGHQISPTTVWRILKDMGLSMKANKKKIVFKSNGTEQEKQFQYIASQRKLFGDAGLPIISVDTKKKESVGNFYNKGKTWCKEPEEVYTHDFVSMADYRTVPYGIYDVTKNKGYVFVGISGDTPEFAVDAITAWWKSEGEELYPGLKSLLILADGGGSNGSRAWAWKQQIQEKLCNQLGLIVTVCHYPPGCSKWNPVERRLFSYISINWAGKPLRSLDIMLGYIRGTSTKTGLTVKAYLQTGTYKRGQKVTKETIEALNLQFHTVCPKWNYTIKPCVLDQQIELSS